VQSDPGLRSPVLFLTLWAVGGELMDGLTRFVMPDAYELNRLSSWLGGPASLVVKLAFIGGLIALAYSVRAEPVVSRRGLAVCLALLVAGSLGLVGAWTNVLVLGSLR